MTKTILALCILFCVTALNASPVPTAVVSIRSESLVKAERVVIADIASVKTGSKQLAEKLKAVEVCTSPAPGRDRIITKNDIIIALRRAGIDEKSITISCSDRVSVSRAFNRVAGSRIFEVAKDYASTSTTWPGSVEIQPDYKLNDIEAPTGLLSFNVKDGIQKLHKGHNSIPVEISIDGKPYRTINVSLMIRLIAPVLVAVQPISRTSPITDTNTTVKQMDITNLTEDLIIGSAPAGWTATIQIADGAIIRKGWIAEPAAIKSGDPVMVVAQSGLVKVTDRGIAAQDGRVGETIKIRMVTGSREIRCKVAEPGIVTL